MPCNLVKGFFGLDPKDDDSKHHKRLVRNAVEKLAVECRGHCIQRHSCKCSLKRNNRQVQRIGLTFYTVQLVFHATDVLFHPDPGEAETLRRKEVKHCMLPTCQRCQANSARAVWYPSTTEEGCRLRCRDPVPLRKTTAIMFTRTMRARKTGDLPALFAKSPPSISCRSDTHR